MTAEQIHTSPSTQRRIAYRTKGHAQGSLTRLMSPGDLGELVKPFVFLDYFEFAGLRGGRRTRAPALWYRNAHDIAAGLVGVRRLDRKVGHAELGQRGMDASRRRRLAWRDPAAWTTAGRLPALGGVASRDRACAGRKPLRRQRDDPPQWARARVARSLPRDGQPDSIQVTRGVLARASAGDGERWTYQPPAGHDVAWLAVAAGTVLVDGVPLRREMAVFEEGHVPIDCVAQGDVEFVIGSAVKHPHPLVTGNYSVHTSLETLVLGEAGIEEVASTMKLKPGVPLSASMR